MTTSEVCTRYESSPGTQCLPQQRSTIPRQSFETLQSRRRKQTILFPDRGQIFCPTKPSISICRRPSTAPVPTLHPLQPPRNPNPIHRDDVYSLSQTPGATYQYEEHNDAVPNFQRSPIVNENPQPSTTVSASRKLEICRSLQTPEICCVSKISNFVCYETGYVRRIPKSCDTKCHLLQVSVAECCSSYTTKPYTSQQSCAMCTSPYSCPVVRPAVVHHNFCYPTQHARNLFQSTRAMSGKYCKPHDSVMAQETRDFHCTPSSICVNAPPQISDLLSRQPSNSSLRPQKGNVYFTPLLHASFSHSSLNRHCRSSHSLCRYLYHRENPFVYSFPSSTNCRRVRFSDSICRHSQFENNSCTKANVCRSSKSFHTCHPACSSHSFVSSHTSVTSHESHSSNASCPSRISNIICQTTERREHTLRPYHNMFRQQKNSTIEYQQSQQADAPIFSDLQLSDGSGGCNNDTCNALQNNVDTFPSAGPPDYTSQPPRIVGATSRTPPFSGKILQPSQLPCYDNRLFQSCSNATRTSKLITNIGTPSQIAERKFLTYAPSEKRNHLNKFSGNMPHPLHIPDKVTYCTRPSDVSYPSQEGGNMSQGFQNNPESEIICPAFQNQDLLNRPLSSENVTLPPQTPQRTKRQIQVSGRIITSPQGKIVRTTQVSCNTCKPCKSRNKITMQSEPSDNPLQSNHSGRISVQIQSLPQNVPGENTVYCGDICPAQSSGKITTQSSPSANVNHPSHPSSPNSRANLSDPSHVTTDISSAPKQSSNNYCPESSGNTFCHCASKTNTNSTGDFQSHFSGDKTCNCPSVTAGNKGGNLPPLGTTSHLLPASGITNNYYTDNVGNISRNVELSELSKKRVCNCASKVTDNMTSETTNNMTSETTDNMTSKITDNITCDCQSHFSGDKACNCPSVTAGNTGGNILSHAPTTRHFPPSGITNYHSPNAGNISRYIDLSESAEKIVCKCAQQITGNITSHISGDESCNCPSRIAGNIGGNVSPSGRTNRHLSPSGNTSHHSQKSGNINHNIDHITDNITESHSGNTAGNTSGHITFGDKTCNCPSVTAGNTGGNILSHGTTTQLLSSSGMNYLENSENIGQVIEPSESPEKKVCHCTPQTTGNIFSDCQSYLSGDKPCNCALWAASERDGGKTNRGLSPSGNTSYHSQNSGNIIGPESSENIVYNSVSQTSGNITCDCKSHHSGDTACNCPSRNTENIERSLPPPGKTIRILQPSDNEGYQSQHSVKECKAKRNTSRHLQPSSNIGHRSQSAGNANRTVSPPGNVIWRPPQPINIQQPTQISQSYQPSKKVRPCQTSDIPCHPQCPRQKCIPSVPSDASHPSHAAIISGKSKQPGNFYQPHPSDITPCNCPSVTSVTSNTSCDCSTLGTDNISSQINSNVISRKLSPSVKFNRPSPATIKITPSETVNQTTATFGNVCRNSSKCSNMARRSPKSGNLRHTSKHSGDTYLHSQSSRKTIYPTEPSENICTSADCEGTGRLRNRGKIYQQRKSSREKNRSPESYENVPNPSEGLARQSPQMQSSGILKRSSRPCSRSTRSPQQSESICPQLSGNVCPQLSAGICPSQLSGNVGFSQLSSNPGPSQLTSSICPAELFENISQDTQSSGYMIGPPQHTAIMPCPATSTSTCPSQCSGQDVSPRRSARDVDPSKRSGYNICPSQRTGNNICLSQRSVVCPSQRSANIICPSQRSSKNIYPSQRKRNKACTSPHTCNEQCPGKMVRPSQYSSMSSCSPECSGTGLSSSQQSQNTICPSQYSDYIICPSDNSDLLVCTSENSGYSFHNSDESSSQPTQSSYSFRRRRRGERSCGGSKRSPSFRCSTILNRANISSKISISVKKTKLNRSSQPMGAIKNSSKPSVTLSQPSQESDTTRKSSKSDASQSKNTLCYPLLVSGIPCWNIHSSNNNLAFSPLADSISNRSQPSLGRVCSRTDTSEIIRPFSQPCGKTIYPFIFPGRGARSSSPESDILHSFPRSVSSPPSPLGSTDSNRVSDNLHLVSDPSSHLREPSTIYSNFSNKSISFFSPENVNEVFRSVSYHSPRTTSSRSLHFVFRPFKASDPPISFQEESPSSDKRSSSA